jgi:hypothetical protein
MKNMFAVLLCCIVLTTPLLAATGTIAPNGTFTSTFIPDPLNYDTITLSLTSDAAVRLTLTCPNYIGLNLYESTLSVWLNRIGDFIGTQSTDLTPLGSGTYRILVHGSGTYTLSNTVVVPDRANDVEPNDSARTAKTILPISTSTGHLGYFIEKIYNTDDWYKVNSADSGKLSLKLRRDSTLILAVTLYNETMNILATSSSVAKTDSIVDIRVSSGATYILLHCGGYGSYELGTAFAAAGSAVRGRPLSSPNIPFLIRANGRALNFIAPLSEHATVRLFSQNGSVAATLCDKVFKRGENCSVPFSVVPGMYIVEYRSPTIGCIGELLFVK